MAPKLNLHFNVLHRILKSYNWKSGRPNTPPALNEGHIKARREWLENQKFEPADIWFHLDEKYFGNVSYNRHVWYHDERETYPKKSKRWGYKVMVMGLISNEKDPELMIVAILEEKKKNIPRKKLQHSIPMEPMIF